MTTEESDITLGPGKLLGLFFTLVAICGVFFAIGYSLGKTAAREQALKDMPAASPSKSAPVVGDANAAKPSAVVSSKNGAENTASAQDEPANGRAPDLTFFNSVKQSGHKVPEAAPAAPKAAQANAAEKKTATADATNPSASTATPPAQPAALTRASQGADATGSGAFVVQIAAVTREEDAAALAGALRRKNYSVFVVNNPAVHDKFYHVQIGPFDTAQAAEAMKAKLSGEGYNPIVKHS
jgi:cell division septation protein DedD